MPLSKSGVVVEPSTSICLKVPLKFPSEESTPPIESNTPRSALDSVYVPETGVPPGSEEFQGPNCPEVWISPAGIGLSKIAANLMAPVPPRFCTWNLWKTNLQGLRFPLNIENRIVGYQRVDNGLL